MIRRSVSRLSFLALSIALLSSACGKVIAGPVLDEGQGKHDVPFNCPAVFMMVDEWWIPDTPDTYFRDDWSVFDNRSAESIETGIAQILKVSSTAPDADISIALPLADTGISIEPWSSMGDISGEIALPTETTPLAVPVLSLSVDYPRRGWPPQPISIEVSFLIDRWLIHAPIRLIPEDVDTMRPRDTRSICAEEVSLSRSAS